MHIEFSVPKLPVPQGDLRASRNGKLYHSNKALEPWRYEVAWRGRKAMRQAKFRRVDGEPLSMSLAFVLYRPKSTSKNRPTPPAVKKPDLDKLVRAIGDALTGVVYLDDSQIVQTFATKRVAEEKEPPHAIITVTTDLTIPVQEMVLLP